MTTTAETVVRTNVSTATKKTDDFTFGEWRGQFVYEYIEGHGVSSVQVNATNTNRYFSATIGNTNNNINFSGVYDSGLVSAVLIECDGLIVSTEPEVQ